MSCVVLRVPSSYNTQDICPSDNFLHLRFTSRTGRGFYVYVNFILDARQEGRWNGARSFALRSTIVLARSNDSFVHVVVGSGELVCVSVRGR